MNVVEEDTTDTKVACPAHGDSVGLVTFHGDSVGLVTYLPRMRKFSMYKLPDELEIVEHTSPNHAQIPISKRPKTISELKDDSSSDSFQLSEITQLRLPALTKQNLLSAKENSVSFSDKEEIFRFPPWERNWSKSIARRSAANLKVGQTFLTESDNTEHTEKSALRSQCHPRCES